MLLMGRYELLCRSVWHIIVRDKHVVGSMGAGGDWDVIHYFLGKSQEQILSLLDSYEQLRSYCDC